MLLCSYSFSGQTSGQASNIRIIKLATASENSVTRQQFDSQPPWPGMEAGASGEGFTNYGLQPDQGPRSQRSPRTRCKRSGNTLARIAWSFNRIADLSGDDADLRPRRHGIHGPDLCG